MSACILSDAIDGEIHILVVCRRASSAGFVEQLDKAATARSGSCKSWLATLSELLEVLFERASSCRPLLTSLPGACDISQAPFGDSLLGECRGRREDTCDVCPAVL